MRGFVLSSPGKPPSPDIAQQQLPTTGGWGLCWRPEGAAWSSPSQTTHLLSQEEGLMLSFLPKGKQQHRYLQTEEKSPNTRSPSSSGEPTWSFALAPQALVSHGLWGSVPLPRIVNARYFVGFGLLYLLLGRVL